MKKQLTDEARSHIRAAGDNVAPSTAFNSFIVVLNDGSAVVSGGRACTAWLTDGYTKGIDEDVAAILSINQIGGSLTDEDKLPYLDWLINRSPYSSTFISDDATAILADKYIISSPDAPSNLMIGGLIAHRCIWEMTNVVKAFNIYTSMGISEDLAFLIANKTNIKCSGTMTIGSIEDPHMAVAGSYGKEAVKAFLNHKPAEFSKKWSSGRLKRGIFSTWGECSQNYISDKLWNLTGEETEDAKRINNPFVLAYDKGNKDNVKLPVYNLEVLAKFLPPVCHSIIEELS